MKKQTSIDYKGKLSVSLSKETENNILEFVVSIGTKESKLWFSVEKENESFLCRETADGIAVILLPYALRFGYDLEFNLPLSSKLYYNLTEQIIPQLCCCNIAYNTRIIAPTANITFNGDAVATAISCGVDSFTTLKEYTAEENMLPEYKLTHLTFYENGAHHMGKVGYYEGQEELFSDQLKNAEEFCRKYGYKLVAVRSNIEKFLSEFFGKSSFDHTHTYRNVGFSLLLQKRIRTYYYSSAYNIDAFRCSLRKDSARYEKFLLPLLSTENFTAYNSNRNLNRTQKIEYISDFEQTYDNLSVCYMSGENCGKCTKCVRTIVCLDVLGLLDKYKNSFDVEEYKKNKKWYLTELCKGKYHNPLLKEIWQKAKEKGFKVPFGCKVKGFFGFISLIFKYVLVKLRILKHL